MIPNEARWSEPCNVLIAAIFWNMSDTDYTSYLVRIFGAGFLLVIVGNVSRSRTYQVFVCDELGVLQMRRDG